MWHLEVVLLHLSSVELFENISKFASWHRSLLVHQCSFLPPSLLRCFNSRGNYFSNFWLDTNQLPFAVVCVCLFSVSFRCKRTWTNKQLRSSSCLNWWKINCRWQTVLLWTLMLRLVYARCVLILPVQLCPVSAAVFISCDCKHTTSLLQSVWFNHCRRVGGQSHTQPNKRRNTTWNSNLTWQ